MKDEVDIAAYLSTSGPQSHAGTSIIPQNGQGANLVVVDLVPGGETMLHRTVSIDFSICTNGQVCMELDTGEQIELKPGVNLSLIAENVQMVCANGVVGPRYTARHAT
jgi:hypothetical protein